MAPSEALAERISWLFSSIYFHCHPSFNIELSHQAVRALQYVHMTGPVTVQQVAAHLQCAQNTASEILQRLQHKGLVCKVRRIDDERVVEVHLTEAGYEAVRQHTGLDIERLACVLESLQSEQRERIEAGLTLLFNAVRGNKKC